MTRETRQANKKLKFPAKRWYIAADQKPRWPHVSKAHSRLPLRTGVGVGRILFRLMNKETEFWPHTNH